MKSFFFFILLLFTVVLARGQNTLDSAQRIRIINAKNLYWKNAANNSVLEILSGKVAIQQDNTLFYCDSCIYNPDSHLFEAFGNVHIKDNDTVDVYSSYLRYFTNTKLAYLSGGVKLTDGHGTLTTPDLDYDVNTKIGTYKNGGKVVNKKSVLTSKEGVYYADIKDVYFKDNVELKDPAYYLKTDSLLYNTQSQIARFIAETYLRDSSKRVVRTREGYYDMAHRHAEFTSHTTIEDGSMVAAADHVVSDDSTNIIELVNHAVVRDTAKGTIVLAEKIFVDKKKDAMLATKKPLMIVKQDKDSIYVAADTLFSARLTDLYKKDSAKLKSLGLKEKDSTNRYFEAYRNVRVFSDSMQSVSDSLFYSFKDSIFQLYYNPVVWSKKTQITGDTIFLYTKNKKADRVRAYDNSFMANEVERGVYNQIKSVRMEGYFKEGKLDSVRAKGLAQSVYFLQDKDSAFTGVNQTKSDAIDIYFDQGDLYKVIFRSDLKGTLYPISEKKPDEMKLDNFKWLINRRPKTKYELFE